MSNHLEIELQQLKGEMLEMWDLIHSQLKKGLEALKTNDNDLAHEVVANEKRVNAYELKIDRDCENIFALFQPVAVDLRCVLAVLKINTNLERVGDFGEGIARFALDLDETYDRALFEKTRLLEMFQEAISMIEDVLVAFDKEDTKLARSVFKKDDLLDSINKAASTVIADYIRENPNHIKQALHVLATIYKLERVGDHAKNIAEEIIFYIEAKVLKHKSKSEKRLL